MKRTPSLTVDPHTALRSVTAARIALGRAGSSLPTREVLDFRFQHAQARDAVQQALRVEEIESGIAALGRPSLLLATRAETREVFLRRPDLGRELSAESVQKLEQLARSRERPPELVLLASDGLSAAAAHTQLVPLLAELLPRLEGWALAPLLLVPLARVAVQDPVGEILGAKLALILLGERPGLGACDSLGAYFTFRPRPGARDADRNCISNIRPAGLGHAAAADTIAYLLEMARRKESSGIRLKDDRQLPGFEKSPPARTMLEPERSDESERGA